MMLGLTFVAWVLLQVSRANSLTDVSNLAAEADFRSVRLHWKYPATGRVGDDSSLSGFIVTYCEDQAWGKYRCKKKVLDEFSNNEIKEANGNSVFETQLDRLRMATNYTVEVSPIFKGPNNKLNRGRAIGNFVKIQTKGFSARAIRCLANSSYVEIETGPYFGGKISVEGTTDKQCSTQGDFLDPKTSYFLKIDHKFCGSNVFNSSVKTFIIVQENLPILTHSTRRFMVVCTYVPETFTVRAGVNLPYDDYEEAKLEPVDQNILEYDVSEYLDLNSNRQSSRASKQVGRAMKFSTESNEEPRRLSHLVLMIIMVIAATVGLVIAVWQFVYRMRKSNRSGFMTPQIEPSYISTDESLDAVVRDFGESLDGSQLGRITPGPPPVALDELNAIDIEDDHSYATLDRRTPDLLDHEAIDRLTPIFINNATTDAMMVNGLSCKLPTDCYFTNNGSPPFGGHLVNDYDQSLQLLSIASADIPLSDGIFGEPRGVLVPQLQGLSTVLETEIELAEDHSIISAINPNIDPFPLAFSTRSGLPQDSDSLSTNVNIMKSRLRSSFRSPSLPTFETTIVYENLQQKEGPVNEMTDSEFESKTEDTDSSEDQSVPELTEPRSLPAPIDTNWQLRDEDGQIFPSLSV